MDFSRRHGLIVAWVLRALQGWTMRLSVTLRLKGTAPAPGELSFSASAKPDALLWLLIHETPSASLSLGHLPLGARRFEALKLLRPLQPQSLHSYWELM